MKHVDTFPSFGLDMEQIHKVEPEYSRQESYQVIQRLVFRKGTKDLADWGCPHDKEEPLTCSLLPPKPSESDIVDRRTSLREAVSGAGEFFTQVCPPQVLAVLIALAIGAGPPWLKGSFVGPEQRFRILGFVYGTTQQLGAGFVPLQMLSLGGRLVGIAGEKGPLAKKGASGPDGPRMLWKISVAVLCARMVVAPIVLYYVALAANATLLSGGRPLAWWLPGLIVASCPTANNMSTMADMVGAGRSISAASTALQLLLSPLLLTVTLSFVITQTQNHLASDYIG